MLLPHAEENKVIRIAWDFLFNYLVYLSILVLLVSSMDRLLNAKYPLHRMKYATWRMAVSIDGLLLLLCLVPAVTRHALAKDKKGVFDYVTSGIVIFFVLVIFCLLAASYVVARKKPMSSSTSTSTASLVSTITTTSFNAEAPSSTDPNHNYNPSIQERKRNRNLLKIILTMSFFYGVTYIPFKVVEMYIDITEEETVGMLAAERSLEILYYLSASINPLITLFGQPDFRKAWLKVFCARGSRNESLTTVLIGSDDIDIDTLPN